MKEEHVERFMLFPFSISCFSESSVDLAVTTTSGSQNCGDSKLQGQSIIDLNSPPQKAKINWGFSKPSVSQGLGRLFNRLYRSLSQLFAYKEEIDHFDKEMEIGFPTDVKHVTHIGLDGSTRTNNSVSTWENSDMLVPSISLEQFELAMAAQSSGPSPGIDIKDSNQVHDSMGLVG